MGSQKKVKLYQKLVLSFLCVCLPPLLAATVVIYEVSARNIEESCMEMAAIFNSQIITNMDEFMEEYDRATRSILVDFDVIHNISEEGGYDVMEELDQQLNMRRIMMRLLTLKPEIRGITLLTVGGKAYHVSDGGRTVDSGILKEQEWILDFQESGDILAVTAVHDKAYCEEGQDELAITVCRRILDYNGKYVGDLLMDIDPDSLIRLDDEFLLERNEYNIRIRITDVQNRILFDSNVASGRMTWQEAVSENDIPLSEQSLDDYIVMSDSTTNGTLFVSIIIPRSKLLFRISNVKYITVTLLISCIAIAIVISTRLSRNITRPIQALQDKMKRMEDGYYEPLCCETGTLEMGSLVCSYNNMAETIRNLIEKVYLAKIEEKNAKLLALQTQVNPHMLYNTLEAIRMKAIINDEDEIADMIQIMAGMFRMALSEHTSSYCIGDDIKYAEQFVALQNIRLPDMFCLKVSMESKVREALIIPLILQPLVENSIEHGYRGGNIPLHMVLEGRISEDGDIVITLRDDGKGVSGERLRELERVLRTGRKERYKQEEKESRDSIGLQNISERIQLYYGEKYSLRIVGSNENGTMMEIRIPGQWNLK